MFLAEFFSNQKLSSFCYIFIISMAFRKMQKSFLAVSLMVYTRKCWLLSDMPQVLNYIFIGNFILKNT